MTLDPRTPVIVGVGQFLHRADGLDDALEPVALMEQAVLAAARDAGLDGPPAADSIRVVSLLSWRYRNPARFLAARLGLEPAELGYTAMGGNSPQSLVNATVARHPGRQARRGHPRRAASRGARSCAPARPG